MFGVRPPIGPYGFGSYGIQPPVQAQVGQPGLQSRVLQQPPQGPQGINPMLQQLLSNPQFIARLAQLRGAGIAPVQPQGGGFGQVGIRPNLGIQPLPSSAYSLR